MASTNELSQAFMPSSNDAMHSPIQPSTTQVAFRNPEFSRMSTHQQTNGYNASSPSRRSSNPQTPSSGRRLSLNTSNRPMHTTTINGSRLPAGATDGPEPSDEDFWYNLHLQALANFELERATWKKMTERLRRDVDKLKDELDELRRGSLHDSAFYSTNGKDADRSTYNEDIRKHAEQKLRQLSVVSPHAVASPDQVLSPTMNGSGERSTRRMSSMRLPSIHENASTPTTKRVSIAEPNISDHIPDPAPTTVHPNYEDRSSSPPIARPQSPSPSSYTLDAGHTPRRNSSSGASKPIPMHSSGRPNARHNSVVPGFTLATVADATNDDRDDDRELDSPKMLPTTPGSTGKGSCDMLDKLCGRLEEVAEHPEENEPEVLKHEFGVVNYGVDGLGGSNVECQGEDGEASEAVDDDKGIKLKARRSLNFGAPLGMSR